MKLISYKNFINENLKKDIESFLIGKDFINTESKRFLYHGTGKSPKDFSLRDDYDYEDSNVWSGDLPEGYLFLTTDINESKAYGQYVIPFELKRYNHITFEIDGNNPSQIFDRDYGIDLYKNDKYYGFWEKFEDSMKSVLIIKGYDKMTLITGVDNVIPRIDLATEFYKDKL